jgi:hypothetical protein
MIINLKNIEELIFYDKKVQLLLPDLRHLFDQWSLGQRFSGMKTLAQRSVLDLLNSLNNEHILKLQEHFGDIIILDKIDNRLVANYSTNVDQFENELCKFTGYRDFCLTRKNNQLEITFWR